MGIKFADITEVIFAFHGRHKRADPILINSRFFPWLIIFFLMQSFMTLVSASFASELWQPVREQTLEVAKGSVLDLSGLFPVQAAGARGEVQISTTGHLHFANEAQPQRFLCASMVPSPPNGGLPTKDEADRWVEQLSRTGYNLVRLQFIDAILMTGRKNDFDFDPVALDRLHYLMARLKSAGIYWIVDGMTSDNGAYGNVQPHRWVNRYNLKERLFYDPDALEHWKRLITSLWGRENPYTGLSPLHDPALLGMILVNEGGLEFLATLEGKYPKVLQAQFDEWLAKHRPDMKSGKEIIGLSSQVPEVIRGNDLISKEFTAFIADQERALFRHMDEYVRSLGFKGLTTAYDNFGYYSVDVARDAANWIDMHAYQSSPSSFADVGSRLAQTSIFDKVGRFGRELTNARHWGKPFTVTEYGQPFWNQWRHESTAWIPALAAFQGWDAICQFAELPVLLEYAKSGPQRRLAMYPFGVGADPITRGGERLAALLFRRGDVTPSRVRVKLSLDPVRVFKDGKAWGQVPEDLSRLALVAGSGLAPTSSTTPKNSSTEIVFSLDDHSGGLLGKVENAALKKGILLDQDPVERLKSSGLLLSNNQTDLSRGLFETDTGQMVFDASRKKLTIATERTVAFTLRSGSAQAGGIELKELSSPATVAVGAVDGRVIGQSRRLLVWVLTDAINTGMEFVGGDRSTLKKLGSFPPMLRAVTGQLAIKHASAATLKVWAVDQTGRRVAQVPSSAEGGYLRFAVDNVVSGYGPVTYFEVAEK
jgi:hypothetical protein